MMYKCIKCGGLTKTRLTIEGLCFKCMQIGYKPYEKVDKKKEWLEQETFKIRNDW